MVSEPGGSNNAGAGGAGRRRRINPVLLLGGEVAPEVVESGDFEDRVVKPVVKPVGGTVGEPVGVPGEELAVNPGAGVAGGVPAAGGLPGVAGVERGAGKPVKPEAGVPGVESGVEPGAGGGLLGVNPRGGRVNPGVSSGAAAGAGGVPVDAVAAGPTGAGAGAGAAGRGRPAFFLESDRLPVGRPVDFSRNKKKVIGGVGATGPTGAGSGAGTGAAGGRSSSKGWVPGPYVSKPPAGVVSDDWDEEGVESSAGLGGEVDDRFVKPQYGRGFHLTERDLIMMKFLARYRYAYVDQLARLVDSIPRNIVGRLRVLEGRGFIRREPITDRQYLWTVRKAGLVLVDSAFREIKKGSLSYATIAHTIGLANLGVELEREAGGKDLLGEGKGVVGWVAPERRWKLGVRGNPDGLTRGEMTVTEREIRQGQMRWRGNRSYKELRELVDAAVLSAAAPELEEGNEGLFVVYGPGGKGGEHVPDLVVQRERDENGRPAHIAIELELTPKTPTEWRKILRNYRDNGLMFSKVYYFTHKKSIGNVLSRLADEEGFSDKFVVRKYVPQNSRMPFWG